MLQGTPPLREAFKGHNVYARHPRYYDRVDFMHPTLSEGIFKILSGEQGREFRRFLDSHSHITKWMVAADFCFDRNFPNKTYAITLLPASTSYDEIIKKIKEYKETKKDYYEQNKEKRLEYDKEYRERKKEELKKYRKEYYKRLKEKQNKL